MTAPSSISFWVEGIPAMQGSKVARVINGKAVMFEANKKFQAWRSTVVLAASQAINDNQRMFDEPIRVDLSFWLPRPRTVTRKYPTAKNDLDKMARLVNDALTISKLIKDDGQIVRQSLAKDYETETVRPGVFITISTRID